ncbi:MAG: esterase/lipase family protein [Methylobacter sp.]
MNIVLAHGILGFRTLFGIHYFNGIKKHLEQKFQCKVLVAEVDPTSGISDRGAQLRQQILEAIGLVDGHLPTLNPDDETHIIAHSMGGLDSRFILSQANPDNIAKYVTSLTTIGTPHRGSPIADLLYPWVDGKANLSVAMLGEEWAREFLSKLGVSVNGLRDLTTEFGNSFDEKTTDNASVKYFWTTGVGRAWPMKASGLLWPSYEYMKLIKGEDNDGAVPISSASHGELISDLWLADHLDEVGHDLNNLPNGTPPSFKYLKKYEQITERVLQLH